MSHLFKRLSEDLRFYQRLRKPGQEIGIMSAFLTLIISRGLWLLWMQRLMHFCYVHRNHKTPAWWIIRLLASLGKYRNTVISKSELQDDCDIKDVAYLPDKGNLICGARSIGSGTIIHDHVTFGFANRIGADGRPDVGSNVWVGPRCIIAGAITIGDGSTILPNTYLTFDVPPYAVVRGNPGRIIATDFNNAELRQSLNIVTEIARKS